jgi:alpha-D-ribose 1-methylphosphonate 5-phosphate C-P lyase
MKLEILKWVATATLIVGFGLFSAGIEFGWYLQITGGIIWLTAAVIMKDKALMVTNGAMTMVGIIGKLFG